MIKSLSIQNFQSHKDTCLEFDKGVNVIVGSSDSGKTAIIRALRWLVWNRPSGDSMRSNWGGKTSVELFTDDVHIIRSKDKEAEYVLGDTHFKAFSTDVPKEISDALNLSEINLQMQFDKSFLLTETPGAVAHHFNKVARLDKIDTGLQNVQKWIRELEQGVKYKKGQLEQQETALLSYAYLEKMEIEVEVLEGMEKQLQTKESGKQRLEGLIEDYQENQKEIVSFEETISDEKLVNQTLKLIEDKDKLDIEASKIDRLIVKLNSVKFQIQEYEQVTLLEEKVKQVLKLIEEKDKLDKTRTGIEKIIKNILTVGREKSEEELNLKDYQETFDKEMPDICPLCNQPIKKK